MAFFGLAFALASEVALTIGFATTFTTDLLVDLTAALVALVVDLAAVFMEALLDELGVLAVFFTAAVFVELFVTTDVIFFAGFFIALAIESNQPKQTSHLKHKKSKSLQTIRAKKQCAFPNSNKPFSLRRSFGLLGGADAHLNNTFLLSTITM
jgi:chromate transport protein ChrA